MLSSTSYLYQSPATERLTAPWLKHGVFLHTNTQLSFFRVTPTQHVGEGEGMSTGLKRQRQ